MEGWAAQEAVVRSRRDQLGEGPVWSARHQALFWVDILGARLNRLTLEGRLDSWEAPSALGWVVETLGGGFLAGLRTGLAKLDLDPMLWTPLPGPDMSDPDLRFNDGKADRRGRVWAGTMSDAGRPVGALHRIDPDRTWSLRDEGYLIPNGPAFSVDGAWLWHADSGRGVVYRAALSAEGELGPREPFIRFPPEWGSPDGMTVDRDDALWVACWGSGALRRFSPDGELMRTVALPVSQVTSCAFGGPDLDRLFVTSAAVGRPDEPLAGALFEVDPGGVRGVTADLFAG